MLMKKSIVLILVFLFSYPLSIHAEEFKGKVVAISDGDTLTVLNSLNQQIKIRLSEIDTPESSQPYGNRSKQQLSGLVFGKSVSVKTETIDRYGRSVAKIYVDDIYVNAKMIELGAAWVYRQYAKDENLYYLEDKAKELKIGLWGLPETERIPPWEWRKTSKGKKVVKDVTSPKELVVNTTESNFSCGRKSTCSQMVSCKEANYYLKVCGLGRLDRDKDGIPCESICL